MKKMKIIGNLRKIYVAQLICYCGILILLGCGNNPKIQHSKVKSKPVAYDPWRHAHTMVAFTFEPRNFGFFLRDHIDPWNFLNKKFHLPEDTFDCLRFDEAKMQALYKQLHKDITAKELEWDRELLQPKDCGFMPRHAFVFLDKNGVVKAYLLVCFECQRQQSYGVDISTGTIGRLFRYCQFNGLRYGLDGMEAMHTFATTAEIDCWKLRKHPEEIITCK